MNAINEQNRKLASGIQSKEVAQMRRYRKPWSFSTLGRSGATPACVAISGKPVHSREALFKAQLREALEASALGRLYPLWQAWVGEGYGEVPLSNEELRQTRHQAAAAARSDLRAAVRAADGTEGQEGVREALRAADAIAARWPFARSVQSSLEYAAASRSVEEATASSSGGEQEEARSQATEEF